MLLIRQCAQRISIFVLQRSNEINGLRMLMCGIGACAEWRANC
jgi:hypothetical protein